ncbi:hypothetical protein BU14_2416s0001, partial [Porphyra umbilicalis]
MRPRRWPAAVVATVAAATAAAVVATAPAPVGALNVSMATPPVVSPLTGSDLIFARSTATLTLADGSRTRYGATRPVDDPGLAALRARSPIEGIPGFVPGSLFREWSRLAADALPASSPTDNVRPASTAVLWHGVGGVTVDTTDGWSFGQGVAAVGDVDGDGMGDLAVSSGQQWPVLNVLFIDAATGGVDRQVKTNLTAAYCAPYTARVPVTAPAGGRGGPDVTIGFERRAFTTCGLGVVTTGQVGYETGPRFVRAGDVDGDGVPDIVGYQYGMPRVFLHLLNADGTVKRTTTVDLTAWYSVNSNYPTAGPDIGQVFALGNIDGTGVGGAVAVRAYAAPVPTPLPPRCFGANGAPTCAEPAQPNGVVLVIGFDRTGAVAYRKPFGLDGVGLFFIPSLPANVAPKRNWDALGFGAVGLGLGRLPNGATGLVVGAGGFGVAPAVSRLYLVELAPSGDVAAATALAVDALFPPVGDRLTAFLPPDAVITTPWRRRVVEVLPLEEGRAGAVGTPLTVLLRTATPNACFAAGCT